MRKRVLLAEQSDAIRGVAETALRQSGFEVISVATAEKALEVLKFSRPDLMILGGELQTADQKPLYEKIRTNPRAGQISMLLFDDSGSLPFPPESIISRPFDATQFLQKVMLLASQAPNTTDKPVITNPLEEANLDDDLLDAALGIDQIDVTASEVMDKTTGTKRKEPKPAHKFVGLEHTEGQYGDVKDSGKVESLMIRDAEATDIRSNSRPDKKILAPSASGKLDILSDQFMITDPNAVDRSSEDRSHDYEWFIDEMRKEVSGSSETSPAEKKPDTSPDLNFSEPSAMVDPVTPPPETPVKETASSITDGGVDKFIDDFKKEVEKIQEENPPAVNVPASEPLKTEPAPISHRQPDRVLTLEPEQVAVFTQQLCRELAEKIAEKIVARIDPVALADSLKEEILSCIKHNSPEEASRS
ncbi:MAG: response regulator [bacterium]